MKDLVTPMALGRGWCMSTISETIGQHFVFINKYPAEFILYFGNLKNEQLILHLQNSGSLNLHLKNIANQFHKIQ